ncbi:MAG: asparagine synthase (glutamine-hydrolyzing), partial [Gemmatimonadaceae bacterium]|nr:asparagine synthase (glutamine-hydrolyzing) [Gemmatimonadaceae bacterium]
MCGVSGAYGAGSGTSATIAAGVRRMTAQLTHRGPDDRGWLQRDDVILAHNRLSIIDLSDCGRQPMPNETGTVWACYNGEIYNYDALRAQLAALGHHFNSKSDTEVLVHGYESWGIHGLLTRLRGMFAFALYEAGASDNAGSGVLYLARDRFGIKPLYFSGAADGSTLIFASEVRALMKSGSIRSDEDPRGWLGYLLFGSVPSPWTTYRAIQTLPAGCYLEARPNGFKLDRYFDVGESFLAGEEFRAITPHAPNGRKPVDAKEDFHRSLRSVLEETVRLHLLSDAPLGVFLSGGIDSSALVSLAAREKQELRTVGIVFDEAEYSEERYQRMVAERYHTDHRSIRITAADGRDG